MPGGMRGASLTGCSRLQNKGQVASSGQQWMHAMGVMCLERFPQPSVSNLLLLDFMQWYPLLELKAKGNKRHVLPFSPSGLLWKKNSLLLQLISRSFSFFCFLSKLFFFYRSWKTGCKPEDYSLRRSPRRPTEWIGYFHPVPFGLDSVFAFQTSVLAQYFSQAVQVS